MPVGKCDFEGVVADELGIGDGERAFVLGHVVGEDGEGVGVHFVADLFHFSRRTHAPEIVNGVGGDGPVFPGDGEGRVAFEVEMLGWEKCVVHDEAW